MNIKTTSCFTSYLYNVQIVRGSCLY